MRAPIVVAVGLEGDTLATVTHAAGEQGLREISARTIQDVVAMMERESLPVAAVFCAVALPDGNWCDLLETLAARGCTPPVVLCAKERSAETWWDALEKGVWEVLAPPITAAGIQRILAAQDAIVPAGERKLAMKTIGLIGGMSWESSALYYRIINEETKRRRGGHHNARSVMVTIDFADADHLMHAGDWNGLGALLCDAAQRLERSGAECVLICTNTMHKLAGSVEAAVSVPLLHIADATAAAILEGGHRRVGLLATRFTMEEPFYRDRLKTKFDIEAIVPPADSRAEIHRIIFEELCHGINRPESRDALVRIMEEFRSQGATGVILGCTEIELLITAADSCLPIFPSARLHALAAVEYSLSAARA